MCFVIASFMYAIKFASDCISKCIYHKHVHHMQKPDTSKFKFLFPHVHVPSDSITAEEQRYMSTDRDAWQTIHYMKAYCHKHGHKNLGLLTIADAHACLGGNTHSFYIMFKKVVVYEVDTTRFEKLRAAVQRYGAIENKDPVEVRGDCLGEGGILNTYQDVIFLDPPWATPGTEEVGAYVFEDAAGLCQQIAERRTAQFIFLKLPLQANFPDEFKQLHENMKTHWKDISNKMIYRRHGPTYTIVCAVRKDLSTADTQGHHKRWHRQAHLLALLTQLHACSFFIET